MINCSENNYIQTHERNNFLKLLTTALFSPLSSEKIINFFNITDLLSEAGAQSVFPLVSQALQRSCPAEAAELNRLTFPHIASNMRISYEHLQLHRLMGENSVPYVVLKGAASASYYPEPVLREMGDVDFLVREADFERAGSVLKSSGFEPVKDTGGNHVAYHKGPDSVWELHRGINGIPGGEAGHAIKGYLDTIIDTAVDCRCGDGFIRVPDAFHHCLVLLLHTAGHLTAEGIGLRHLCDWAVFAGKVDISQWRDELKVCGLWRFAQILTQVSVKYLGLPSQPWAVEDCEADEALLEGLIADIFTAGNFGHKDADRYRQIKYVSNRGEHTVDKKSPLKQVISTVRRKAEAEKKSGMKVILDYVGIVLRGERRIDTSGTLKAAAERKKLYSEFRLFEPSER